MTKQLIIDESSGVREEEIQMIPRRLLNLPEPIKAYFRGLLILVSIAGIFCLFIFLPYCVGRLIVQVFPWFISDMAPPDHWVRGSLTLIVLAFITVVPWLVGKEKRDYDY